jgi:hypothetical protein
MQLGVRLKLKIRRIVHKLRRRKFTGKDIPIQNALHINAEGVDTVHLPNSNDLRPCRLLDLPVELLLHILELLWEPGPFYSSQHPYSLASLRLLVHHHSILILYSPSN